MKTIKYSILCMFILLSFNNLQAKEAQKLGLFNMKEKSYRVGTGENSIIITRTFTSCAKNKGFFQPIIPAKGITPVTEIEILHALNDKNAIVVDMRIQDHYFKGTIPLAVNIPYGEIETRLDELGCKEHFDSWDCSEAKKVYGFCNGPVCAQSPIAMNIMIRNGFPANKIYYYRGGMLDWSALGLTTVKGEF